MYEDVIKCIASPVKMHDLKDEVTTCLGWLATVIQNLSRAYSERHSGVIDVDTARHTFGKRLQQEGVKVTEAYLDRAYVEDAQYMNTLKRLNSIKEEEQMCSYLHEALKLRHQALVALISKQIQY